MDGWKTIVSFGAWSIFRDENVSFREYTWNGLIRLRNIFQGSFWQPYAPLCLTQETYQIRAWRPISINDWWYVIYNHPIGRKNATYIPLIVLANWVVKNATDLPPWIGNQKRPIESILRGKSGPGQSKGKGKEAPEGRMGRGGWCKWPVTSRGRKLVEFAARYIQNIGVWQWIPVKHSGICCE